MTKISKRFLLLLLSITLSFSAIVPVSVYAETVDCWEVVKKDAVGSVSIDTEVFFSGNSSIKIVNETPRSSNKYILLKTPVTVEAGKKYYIRGRFKTNGGDNLAVNVDWADSWSLTTLTKSFDWTEYEYTYTAADSKTVMVQILAEGVTKGFWIDDFQFISAETGENMIKNSETVPVQRVDDKTGLEEVYNRIKTSSSFKADEMKSVAGGFKYIPVYKTDNASNARVLNWDKYPVLYMPTLSTQYQVYVKDSKDKDVSAECRFAYDEEYLYMKIDVEDDIFNSYKGSASYWSGDSIQMAISAQDENFGTEIGLVYLPDENKGEAYATSLEEKDATRIILNASQDGIKTIYEAAIPWDIKFKERPDEILFDILANDNDGSQRRYCAELAPGISEGKVNSQFPKLEMLDTQTDWYAWVQGDRDAYTETDYVYEYYLVNEGEEKTFTVKNLYNGAIEEIYVPAGEGIRREMDYRFDEEGIAYASIEISDGENIKTLSERVVVKEKLPSLEETQEIISNLRTNAAILKELIDKCEAQGISTDYEMVSYKVIDRFAEYLEDDIEHDDFTRINYTKKTTDTIFEEAKADLEAYLAGEKTPMSVPRYITSKVKIDGSSLYALADNNGVIEERPTFFVGYGHGNYVKGETENFSEWGVNSIHVEIGPHHCLSIGDLPYWNQAYNDGAKYGKIERTTEDAYSGKYSAKMTFSEVPQANVYLSIEQLIVAEPGKTYEFSGYVKANNDTRTRANLSDGGFTPTNWVTGTYDWKKFSVRYTVPEGKNQVTAKIICDGKTDGIYFDDLRLCEVGDNTNLLENPGFEEEPNESGVYFNKKAPFLSTVLDVLDKAEKNNISVDVLISPHYFPTNMIELYDMGYRDIAYFKFNIDRPEAKKILEAYARGLIPVLKDYKSIKSLCIANEPQFRANTLPDYYLEYWHEFIKNRYNNDISALNKSYGTEYNDFTEVDFDVNFEVFTGQIPAKWNDYKLFNDSVLIDWHNWLADIVKEIAPDLPIHTKVQKQTFDYQSMIKLIGVPFYKDLTSFLDLNGCDATNYFNVPGGRLQKEMWYDFISSMKDAPIINAEDHVSQDRDENFTEEQHRFMAQQIWQGAFHGLGISDIWVWQRDYNKFGEIWGSILYRPDAIKYTNDFALDLNRLAYEVTAVKDEKREVGIIYSDASVLIDPLSMHATYQAYAASVYNGKRPLFIVRDMLENINDCKLVIVPYAKYVTDETLLCLKQYIENGGKVVIMGEETLSRNVFDIESDKQILSYIKDNSTVIEYEGKTDEMLVPTQKELFSLIRDKLKEEKIYYVSVVDADTNEPFTDVEFNVGAYNGDILVNLINLGDEQERRARVYVGGNIVTNSEELIDGGKEGEVITLTRFEPKFIKISGMNPFFDTYGHWAEEDIVSLSGKQIVSGMSHTRYAPDDTLTRAQFLALLTRAADFDAVEYDGSVADVDVDKWYAQNVAQGLKYGIISASDFRPEDAITREEMCDMLVKCYEVKYGEIQDYSNVAFGDIQSDIISKASSAGLIFGYEDGNFKPYKSSTRAEAASVIMRFLK